MGHTFFLGGLFCWLRLGAFRVTSFSHNFHNGSRCHRRRRTSFKTSHTHNTHNRRHVPSLYRHSFVSTSHFLATAAPRSNFFFHFLCCCLVIVQSKYLLLMNTWHGYQRFKMRIWKSFIFPAIHTAPVDYIGCGACLTHVAAIFSLIVLHYGWMAKRKNIFIPITHGHI